jgi:integrase
MPVKRKKKSQYTIRSDGLIVMSKTIDGKRRYFYGKSDAEVEAKYKAATAEPESPKARTFKDVADAWWEEKEDTVSPNSVHGMKTGKKYAVEAFGDKPVTEITPHDVVQYLRRFSAKDYSQKTIANKKTVLKSIFDYAFLAGDIDRNPCADLPSIRGKAKEPRQPASDADIALIEQHKNDSNIARMYYFMLYTGLRRGEAVALQYKHIDRKAMTARVEQSCAWADSAPVLKTPKTSAGIRTVALTDNVLTVIEDGHKPEEYIFFPDGLPRRRAIEKGFEEYRRQTGVTATPHMLRHSYASMLHSAGIDVKDAQVLLGHSSIIMTQDIYTHLEQAHAEAVREKLNEHIKAKKL